MLYAMAGLLAHFFRQPQNSAVQRPLDGAADLSVPGGFHELERGLK